MPKEKTKAVKHQSGCLCSTLSGSNSEKDQIIKQISILYAYIGKVLQHLDSKTTSAVTLAKEI